MLFLLFGCTEKQVSTEIPYTVQIKQIRSYYKALDIEKRLEGMGVSTYIISEATEDGDWYRIVSGAEKSLADIQELKEKIQNKIGIDDLEIINYQTIESNVIVNFKQDLTYGCALPYNYDSLKTLCSDTTKAPAFIKGLELFTNLDNMKLYGKFGNANIYH